MHDTYLCKHREDELERHKSCKQKYVIKNQMQSLNMKIKKKVCPLENQIQNHYSKFMNYALTSIFCDDLYIMLTENTEGEHKINISTIIYQQKIFSYSCGYY